MTAQPQGYVVGPDIPTLRWQVASATSVEVWELVGDSATGLRPVRIISTDSSGSLGVCPGTVDGGRCVAAYGTYGYELRATGVDGSVVTTPIRSFEIYLVIN